MYGFVDLWMLYLYVFFLLLGLNVIDILNLVMFIRIIGIFFV